jgi:hypothetical protein
MNAQEAEAAYRIVKGQLDARQITVDDYNRRVAELRYQDNTGTWWAISPQDGSWLKWNGSTWVPAFAQATPAAVPATAPSPATQPAQQPVQQPAQQPVAKPSWYIPPVSGGQQKPVAQPVVQASPTKPVQQPAAAKTQTAVTSERIEYILLGVGCVGLAVLSLRWYPFILGILAIVIGTITFYKTRPISNKVAIIPIIGIIIALVSIILTMFTY